MNKIRDGDVYKTITLHGRTFELKYGYYEEYERSSSDPIPIYPDFKKEPQFTDSGAPFVTAMQDACEYYKGNRTGDVCFGCEHYEDGEELLGICRRAQQIENDQ